MSLKTGEKLWPFAENAILFQLVGVPVCIAVYMLIETISGAFPNPHMPLSTWLPTTLKIFFTYGITGGLLLSVIHTWLLSRFRSLPRETIIFRSVLYAGGLAFAESIPLVPLLLGSLAPFIILVPGAVAYGWVVGKRWRRKMD